MIEKFTSLNHSLTIGSPVNEVLYHHLQIELMAEEEDGEGYNGQTIYRTTTAHLNYDANSAISVEEFFKDAIKITCLQILSSSCSYTFDTSIKDKKISLFQSTLDKIAASNNFYSPFMIDAHSVSYYYIDEFGAKRQTQLLTSAEVTQTLKACDEIKKLYKANEIRNSPEKIAQKRNSMMMVFEKIFMLLDSGLTASLEQQSQEIGFKKNKI